MGNEVGSVGMCYTDPSLCALNLLWKEARNSKQEGIGCCQLCLRSTSMWCLWLENPEMLPWQRPGAHAPSIPFLTMGPEGWFVGRHSWCWQLHCLCDIPWDLWPPIIVHGGYVIQEFFKNPPWISSDVPTLSMTNSRSQQIFECLVYA